MVVLTGPNGAGKTNLLEAVSFLAPGRGLRRAPLAEVARINGSHEPSHATRLGACEHAMRERARLLRDGGPGSGRSGGRAEPAWLDALEDTMAREAVATAAARRALRDQLAQAVDHGIGPFPAADL